MPGVPFEDLAQRAGEAVAAGRTEEAARYYRAGLELNPLWADGLWRLALIDFDAERYGAARGALRRLVALDPESGPSWALLGLSEYRLSSYTEARASLSRAEAAGVPEAQAIGREALHYLALLRVRSGDYAGATQLFAKLVLLEPDDPELVLACGLMALRRPLLPSQVEAADLDLTSLAGRATHAALAARDAEAHERFRELVKRYPAVRGVHYVAGLFLSRHASAEGLELLRKEVELYPDHRDAHLEIAFAVLDRGAASDALASAQAAVRLGPELAAAHLVLGRALVATGALERGIAELEDAARRDPGQRDAHLALAQAYAKAGRTADVERERRKLLDLETTRGAH